MKKELPSMSDKELDELFRQINENPEISYQSRDWERMKTQLDHISPNREVKNHGHGYNGWLIGILALVIFLGAGLGWTYWKDGNNEIGFPVENTNPNINKQDNLEEIIALEPNPINKLERDEGNFGPDPSSGLSDSKQKQPEIVTPGDITENEQGIQSLGDAHPFGRSYREINRPEKNISGLGENSIEAKTMGNGPLLYIGQIQLEKPVRNVAKKKDLRKVSRFSFALQFAPDVTALSLNEIKGLGNSVGLNLEYYFKSNLSINTGILYAFKTYQAGEGYYTGYQPAPSGIHGNCWILDVPLNVRYYAFERPLSRWYISGGISTYLMLREKYGLEYSSYGNSYKKNLDLRNQNQHYFGIGNLSIGYERLLSDKISLQIEPYLKVPINGIGEGQISLKSAGALIGLKYNW